MNAAYAKIFESLFDGSLRGKTDPILVFVNILTHTRRGIADIHFRKISDETGIPLDRVKSACSVLESPDPDSRTPDEQGRRIVRLDDHRDWGWRVVNAQKYREMGGNGWNTRLDGRQAGATRLGYVYYALCPAAERVKIGFSANPWARIKELGGDYAGAQLLAMEKGTYETETQRHRQFSTFNIEREWFRFEGELRSHVEQLRSNVVVSTGVSVSVPASGSGDRGHGERVECNAGNALQEIELPSGFPKTVDDALAHCAFVGCDVIFATGIWNKAMGRGGRDAKEVPIRSWRHHLATEWSFEQERRNKEKLKSAGQTNGSTRKPFISELQAQMQAVQRQIECHAANPSSTSYNRNCTELEKGNLRNLRKKVIDLNNQIANGGHHA